MGIPQFVEVVHMPIEGTIEILNFKSQFFNLDILDVVYFYLLGHLLPKRGNLIGK